MKSHRLTPPALVARIVIGLPVVGVAAVIARAEAPSRLDVALFGGLYTATMLGLTAGYHRHFSHRSFRAHPAVRWFLAILGAMALQGPITWWVAHHRRHHAFADREGDPHSPGTAGPLRLRALWHAHLGWMLDPSPARRRRFARKSVIALLLTSAGGCNRPVSSGGLGGEGGNGDGTTAVGTVTSSTGQGTGGGGGEGGGCDETAEDVCNLPIAATQHYTCGTYFGFDSATGRCELVVGCPDNENQFATIYECYAACAPCVDITCDLLPCRRDQICSLLAPGWLECACPEGTGDCGGACVPLDTDWNCGGCGVNCSPETTGRSCEAGQCECPDGTAPNIYTDSENCGSCGHVCTQSTACAAGSCSLVPSACGGCSGSCNYGRCVVTLAENQNAPVAVDVDATSVYWTTADGKVMKAPRDGGVATTLFDDGVTFQQGIAVDATHVYWAGGNAVKRIPLDGGQATTLGTGADATALAVDATYVYWTAGDTIMKVPVDGGVPTTLATGQGASAIAIDATSAYWPNWVDGTIRKVALDGGVPTTLASGQIDPAAIAVDANSVYWTTQSSVMRVPINGGAPVVLASNQPRPMAITVDATSVYFANNQTQVIMKVPLAGGTPVPLAEEGPIWWLALAVDDASLYWADNVSGLGKVRKVTPK